MQKVILDLLPGGVAPIVYASQYDDRRSIRFMLTEGGPDSQYSLNASDVITCNLTKPDGTETVIAVANPGGGEHYVDLVNGADDYDQAGAYLGEMVLTRNTRVIGSANFVLKVEEDAYGGQITTLTATGNPCTFETDLADALVSLTANIVCGGGSGTPSTPIPLVGHSELNLTRCGVNLFDNSNFPSGYGSIVATYNADGTVKLNGTASGNEYFSVPINLPNNNYVMSVGNTSANANVHVSFVNHNNEFYGDNDLSTTSKVVNISGDISAIVFYVLSGTTLTDFTIKPMLEVGTTPSAYEPYNGTLFTVAFGQTVYGGVYDANAGKVTIIHSIYDLGDVNWYREQAGGYYRFRASGYAPIPDAKTTGGADESIICSCFVESPLPSSYNTLDNAICIYNGMPIVRCDAYTDAADFKTAMAGQKVTFTLATPIVIDVPSISVFAENGVNNIVSDCIGDVDVTYIKKV